MQMRQISSNEAIEFLLPKHYSGRCPSISIAFGWFNEQDDLKAVCTFGKPASPSLCVGVCGKEWSQSVYELNRLCRTDDLSEPLSQFVSQCLKWLKRMNWIVVSFSDTAMNHHGYIYQACNFIYTGCTKERTDMYVPNGKHSRHYKTEEQNGLRKVRSAKHRYVYFCGGGTTVKKMKNSLKYEKMPYPKGDNSDDYELGKFLVDKVIDTRNQKEG